MIKIIIERYAKPGKEAELIDLLRQVKAAATLYPGYVSGETMVSADDPSLVLVVATFTSIKAWRAWEKRPERQDIVAAIEALLDGPARVTAYEIV